MTPEISAQDVASALEWYMDIGWDEPMEPVARTLKTAVAPQQEKKAPPKELLGAAEALSPALNLAAGAETLENLKKAVAAFEGLAIRKTATNIVFASGTPAARLMVIGEAPDADDDKDGQAFSSTGPAGQLLDKMMGAIGLSRNDSDRNKAVYLTHVLNWRPPGNRSPSPSEIELSVPFLKKHIELAKPDVLLFLGTLPAKALLGQTGTITKLRGTWLTYEGIPALVTYPPAFLLKSPAKKREVWEDLQDLQKRLFPA